MTDQVFISAIIRLIPCYFLLFYPFANHMRDDGKRLLGSTYVFTLALLTCSIIVSPMAGICENTWIYYLYIFDTLGGFAFFYYNVDLPMPQLLFYFFFIKCYTGNLNLFAWLLRIAAQKFDIINDLIVGIFFMTLFVFATALVPLTDFFRRVLRPLLEEEVNIYNWKLLCLLPIAFFILFSFSLYFIIFRDIQTFSLDEIFFIQLIQAMGTFLAGGIFLKMILETVRNHHIQDKLQTASLHLLMQKREYERLQEVIDRARKIRHDTRHHMSLIKGLALSHEDDEIVSYVDGYIKTSGLEDAMVVCENHAINALVQYYLSTARELRIETDIQLSLPEQLPLPEADVASILGNLIENSLEACRRQQTGQRFLYVLAALQGNMTALIVRNSYSGEIRRNGDNFISSKREGLQEGLGVASVRTITERYGGTMKIEYNNGTFETAILLSPKDSGQYPVSSGQFLESVILQINKN